MRTSSPPKDVDDYIAAAPKVLQDRLKKLRSTIKAAAPKAQERISYGMPYYEYHGRLIYFSFFTNHIGIYIPHPTIQEHARLLKKYETAKATVRFPLDKPLPRALIRTLVRARVKYNEQKN